MIKEKSKITFGIEAFCFRTDEITHQKRHSKHNAFRRQSDMQFKQ